MEKKVLIVQRVLTNYRFNLLQELAPSLKKLDFITSQGEVKGALKRYIPEEIKYNNIEIIDFNAFKFRYKGDSRGTSLFFYPQILKILKNYDTIVLEGTTNLLNNIFIILWAKTLGKKVLWWDAGYSLEKRTFKRKIIDIVVYPFIRMTDVQLAYSTKAQLYMKSYMGARNCSLQLNTINTDYFDNLQDEIKMNIESYQFNENNIKFLYVGAIEERKNILKLIKLVHEMNNETIKYSLCIIGDGDYLAVLKKYVHENQINNIEFTGAIYNKSELKKYYFSSDLFILPGDGGLGILQSLLYGLPAVCFAADGTEEDYMDKEFILTDLEDIKELDIRILRNNFDYTKLYEAVNTKKYIQTFLKALNA